jgi:hypothetical protein
MSMSSHRRLVVTMLTGILLTSTCVLPGARAFAANSRILHATTVSAASCVEYSRGVVSPSEAGFALTAGYLFLRASPFNGQQNIFFHCPLSLSGIDPTSTSNTIQMSSYRVAYQDPSINSFSSFASASLVQTTVNGSGSSSKEVCFGTSNPTVTGPTRTTFPCSIKLAFGSYYWFHVDLVVNASPDIQEVRFYGIDFQ